MTKQQPKQNKSLLTTVRTLTIEQLPQILVALSQLDLADYNKGVNSNRVKNLLEVKLYDLFINNNEQEGKEVAFSFTGDNHKAITVIARTLPYILGLTSFKLEYTKETKTYTIKATMKTPYGSYREGLENEGLLFATPDKNQEQTKNSIQQDAIDEANSILASAGLSQFIAY